jgi:hypothetical protein
MVGFLTHGCSPTVCLQVPTGAHDTWPAFSEEPTLKEKLQGKWVRPNHLFSFYVKRDSWIEYREDKPMTPNNSGTIDFSQKKTTQE